MEKNVIQINCGIMINVNVSIRNIMYLKKNPPTCSCKNRKSLASIMDDSAIICDEVIDADADTQAKLQDEAKSNGEETKIVRANFNEKNITYKTQIFLFFLAFY